MKRTSLAIVVGLTAIMTAPLAANAGGHTHGGNNHKNNYSQPNKSTVPTNYNPSSANAGATAVAGSSSNSGANASNGDQSVDLNNNLHNSNNNSANGGAGGSSNIDLNNQNNNHNSNTNNVQGGTGGSSNNSNEAYGGNAHGGTGIGVGIGKGGEGGHGGQGGHGGTGYGGTGGTSTSNGGSSTSTSGSSGSGNYTNTSIGGNHYNEATQAPQLGAPHAVPGNAGFAYNSYVCNNLQTSVAVSAGNKTSSTSGGVNFIGFGIGGGNSNSDISFPKEYAAGMRTIPLQIAAGTLGSMSTLNVSDTTPSWFASMILRMSADPSDHKQVAQYNAIADQMQTIKTSQIHCPNMQPSVNVTVDNSLKAVREYNNKRHQERQEMRDHEYQERQNAPKPPRRYRTDSTPNGNKY